MSASVYFDNMTPLIVIMLLALSALFSGLTLGVMSLSPQDIKRKMKLGDPRAEKIYPLRKQGNLIIVTLMVGNVAANAILSIYLGSLVPGIVASIVSIFLIAIFGGIIPQAIFSRYALSLSAAFSPLLNFFVYVLYPFCKPLAWCLDKFLGEELSTIFSRKELLHILEEHASDKRSSIQKDEERIAKGALTFGEKLIKDVMTPRSVVKMYPSDTKLDQKQINTMQKNAFSRFVIYEDSSDKIIGTVHIHSLLNSKNTDKTLGQIADKAIYVREDDLLDQALNAFLKTKHHLFIVVNQFAEMVGVVSIEDILEEIMGREIVDEFDQYDDLRAVAKKYNR